MRRINVMLHEEMEEIKSELSKIKRCFNVALKKAEEIEINTTICIKDSNFIVLCRANIISESCHDLNPSVCKAWLGFDAFDEEKLYVKAFFRVESA